MPSGDRVGKIGMDDNTVKVAKYEQWRILEGITIEEELVIGGVQVLMLALVLPTEETLLPDIRETFSTAMLGDAALKTEVFTGGVKFSRRRMPYEVAEVNEMLLGSRTLLQFDLLPLGYKIPCRHRLSTSFKQSVR